MNLSVLLWYRAAAVDFMHRPASRIRLTHELVFRNFRDLRPILPHFRIRSFPKPNVSKATVRVPLLQ
jgi:hypothetical protein